MKRRGRGSMRRAAVWLALVSGGAAAAPPTAPGATLFLSADVRGYVAPCGCSANMRGGIARAAAVVLEARQGPRPVLYLDGGDSLFGATRFPPAQVSQEEAKARTLAAAMKRMGLVVRAAGELDNARGAAFRKGLGLPELPATGVRVLDAGGRKVGVVQADSDASLVARSSAARRQGATFVVALFHRTLLEARKAAGAPGLVADVVVATHTADELSGEENRLARGGVPVVAMQSKGRSLLRLDLSYGKAAAPRFKLEAAEAEAKREAAAIAARIALLDREVNRPGIAPELKALKQRKVEELVARQRAALSVPPPVQDGSDVFGMRFIPLESALPSHPDVQKLVAAYDAQVGASNLAWAKAHGTDCPKAPPGKAAFVGSETCKSCHADAYAQWQGTLHARAWETLEAEGKQFHLNCTGCHVTGWGEPGGVCRLDRVAGREDVGCESCHGPGSLHIVDSSPTSIRTKADAAVCVGCHNRENSPHFDFSLYLPRVLGPGHGAPAP